MSVSLSRMIGILLIAMVAMSEASAAKDIVLEREVILQDELYGAYVIQPQAISPTRDGGYLIGGRIMANQSAWAVKTDSDGKVLWRHDTAVREKLPIGQGAEFTGVTEMGDGSFLLCGNMPREHAPLALLARLDATGHTISEKLVGPANLNGAEALVAWIDRCLKWGDGTVIIGRVHLAFHPAAPSPRRSSEDYYWVLMLDAKGEIVWERLIRPEFDSVADNVESALVEKGGTLVFTGLRNMKTELLRVDAKGEVLARAQFPHRYLLVKPVVADERLQVFGGDPRGVQELLTLDDQLSVKGRVSAGYPSSFIARDAYRMPGQSLVMFGSGLLTSYPPHISRAVSVTPELDAENHVNLERKPFVDGGRVEAATATGTIGEFAAVRPLHKNAPGNEARVGAALDFIRVK